MHLAAHLAAALLIPTPHALAAYNLVREYSGSSFFSGWDFYGNYDNLTNGASRFTSRVDRWIHGGFGGRRCQLGDPSQRDPVEIGVRRRLWARDHQGG